MRIVGGLHRGRTLAAPEGLSTRPTGDRVREAVFNILRHAGWRSAPALEEARILDVFAGTGALGLEALSQGGHDAVFIEQDRKALEACRKNIVALKEESRAKILPLDATRLPKIPADMAPRTLVFLDPPYGKNLGIVALEGLAKQGWLADNAVCVLEMAKKQPEETPAGFEVLDERVYGIVLVRFLKLS